MIAAVVLAAGQSRRMGRPKMILPWGGDTVIGRVVRVLSAGGVDEIVVVTGGARREVEAALAGLTVTGVPVRPVFNPQFADDDMSLSLKTGLGAVSPPVEAALVALGDQPQIETEVVRAVLEAYYRTNAALVVPSYHRRRGHPWLAARPIWPHLMELEAGKTLRDALNGFLGRTEWVNVDTPSVLQDLDTPADYQRAAPDCDPES